MHMITIMTVMLQVTVMVCSHITVICLCFSNNQDVYAHDNYYDSYALSKTWCAHT